MGASNPFLGGIDLFHKLDFTQVGLFGHSRGGEGVRAAYNLYFNDPAGTDWETDIGPVGFRAVYELAPTDIRTDPRIAMPLDADDVAWNSLLPLAPRLVHIWSVKGFCGAQLRTCPIPIHRLRNFKIVRKRQAEKCHNFL